MIKNYLVILAIVFLFISCKTNNVVSYNSSSSSAASAASSTAAASADNDGSIEPSLNRIANPAAARCINDGYKLEPVIKNGVTVEYMCVDPNTGVKCEVWKYFRKECSLKN